MSVTDERINQVIPVSITGTEADSPKRTEMRELLKEIRDSGVTFAPWQPVVVGTDIDETKYPQNNLGRGYEVVGLSSPTQWNELGKEVKNGDFIVFDNSGVPKIVDEEVDLSEYTQRSADETITGDWDFQGAMKVGDYTYNTMYGPFTVEKIIPYAHPSLSSPMDIIYGIDTGGSFVSTAVAFNVDDLGLGEGIVIDLLTEESSITGGNITVRSVTVKESDGTVQKDMSIGAYANGGVPASIGVVSRSDGTAYLVFDAGTEPVSGLYADKILTESGGITIKAALDSKADKSEVPASATSPGTEGQVAHDNDYFYVCVATDTWKRVALETWS